MGEQGIVFLEKELYEIIKSGIPSSWRLSEPTPLFKGKSTVIRLGEIISVSDLYEI